PATVFSLMTPDIHPSAQVAATRIGTDVRVGTLATVGAGAVLEAGCPLHASACVGDGAVIGAGACVGDGAVAAAREQVRAGGDVGAGAVVTRRVPPGAVVQGPVATITGYVDAPTHQAAPAAPNAPIVVDSAVKGVRLHVLREVRDMRGD